MTETELLELAARVREACVQAAVNGYQDAAMAGLCEEGAEEAAISAIRRVNLRDIVDSSRGLQGGRAAT